MRECGLKSIHKGDVSKGTAVTPYAGVWIEIGVWSGKFCGICVTPYAGVWIEIFDCALVQDGKSVTPYAGVWIEIIILIS